MPVACSCSSASLAAMDAASALRTAALRALATRLGFAARQGRRAVHSCHDRTRFLEPLLDVLDDIGAALRHDHRNVHDAPPHVRSELLLLKGLACRSSRVARSSFEGHDAPATVACRDLLRVDAAAHFDLFAEDSDDCPFVDTPPNSDDRSFCDVACQTDETAASTSTVSDPCLLVSIACSGLSILANSLPMPQLPAEIFDDPFEPRPKFFGTRAFHPLPTSATSIR